MATGPRRCSPRRGPARSPPPLTAAPALPALLLVRSAPARRRAALARRVWLGCAFSAGGRAEASIQWVLRREGGHQKRLLAYRGSSKQVERVARRAEMVLEEIPKGNASLLLRNTETRDEGTYSCMVSVASLTAEQTVQLQIEGNSMALGFFFF